MGGDERSAIEVIAEFTSPFEDSLNVLILGDHIDDLEAAEVKAAFDRTRNEFLSLPSVDEEKMAPIKYIKINTSEFFRGKISNKIKKEPCVVYLDHELSKNALNILTNNNSEVDDLEEMLLDKYLFGINQEKFILDLTNCLDERIELLMSAMDARAGEFNYVLVEKYLAIWVYALDEFAPFQFD